MRAIEETPDITLMELREKLIAERGESFAISILHAFYRRHEVTFKKDCLRQLTRARGCENPHNLTKPVVATKQ